MSLKNPIPIFRVFDEAKAKEFYVEFLGFDVEWEHRFADGLPLYAEVSRGDIRIHLSEHHGDVCPGAAVRIETDGLDELHEELTMKEYGFAQPGIEETPWGTKEMSIKDPFGNRLTFVAAD